MRARRAGTPPRRLDDEEPHRCWRGGGPGRLATVVSLPTARAARFGASAPNTPEYGSTKVREYGSTEVRFTPGCVRLDGLQGSGRRSRLRDAGLAVPCPLFPVP